jgi:hypothetical protein
MPILAANAKVDFNGMGSVLASRGVGYLMANILGAVAQNMVKKHSEGLLVCAFILPAIGKISSYLNQNIFIMKFFLSDFRYSICDIADIVVRLVFYSGYCSRFHRFR